MVDCYKSFDLVTMATDICLRRWSNHVHEFNVALSWFFLQAKAYLIIIHRISVVITDNR